MVGSGVGSDSMARSGVGLGSIGGSVHARFRMGLSSPSSRDCSPAHLCFFVFCPDFVIVRVFAALLLCFRVSSFKVFVCSCVHVFV